ncbi:MAG: hypothetical protein HRU24_09120 [Gammaproteobacteria bacterium]|nr:hypothetical protein [Gammaproteobacteria bacterium]
MKIILTIITLLLECFSVYLLSSPFFDDWGFTGYGIIHLAAALTFTVACWLSLPLKFKRPIFQASIFIFVLAFTIPVLGIIGLTTTFMVALYLPKPKVEKAWQEAEDLVLPPIPDLINKMQYGASALREIISFNSDDRKRLVAVNSIGHLPQVDAIPLLKIALNDLTDDVRLLAYASLEKIEFKLIENVERLNQEYQLAPNGEKSYQIAYDYWELCYLGLADGPLKLHYLQLARDCLIKANEFSDLPKVNLLLGRIYLAENNAAKAIEPLKKALASGLKMAQVAPYLADAAFHEHDYEKVRQYMAYLPDKDGNNLSEIREFWLAKRC